MARAPRPPPELRFSAGIDRVEGRKIFTWGRVEADGELCAEAEGIFISISVDTFLALKAQRDGH